MDSIIIQKLTELSEEEKEILLGQKNIRKDTYTRSEEFVVNSKKLLNEGENIGLRLHTRFIDFPEHGHDYMEFMYVYSGSITHIIQSKEVKLQDGDILFLNRHIRHSILKSGKDDIGINFIVSNAFLQFIFHNVENNPVINEFLTRNFNPNGEGEYLFFNTKNCFPIRNLMDNLIYAVVYHTADDNTILSGLISLLFSYLSYYRDTLSNKERISSPEKLFRQSVIVYVKQNYPRASLGELAEKLGYTPVYLSRKIHSLFGVTFQTLLQNERISVAEKLLCTTTLSVDEIIRTVGYENQTHFHTLFKKRNGTTPFQYRNLKSTNRGSGMTQAPQEQPLFNTEI